MICMVRMGMNAHTQQHVARRTAGEAMGIGFLISYSENANF